MQPSMLLLGIESFSHFFSADRDFGTERSSAVLVEVVVEAGDDTVTTLSPLVFFFLEDFDCIGDFGVTAACTEGSATAALVLIARHCGTRTSLSAGLLRCIGRKKKVVHLVAFC